jgi:GNAT superfamily N-acetyltransferase
MNLLDRFDEQLRRRPADHEGVFVGDGWSAVLAVPPDVGRALARLRELPGYAEWKLYGHDPVDLPDKLRAAGLEPGDEEAVVVAEAAAIPPPELDVTVATTPELVEQFTTLADRVFGHESPGIGRELLNALEDEPPSKLATIVLVDGAAVSGGRIDFARDADFAGLYGGVTLPEYRSRGFYRATVAERARLARERGYRWLYVDALPTSRPILERLGFVQITTTTPWTFR